MFVPGNKEDWMRKAPQYGPDALILDLEDSVPEYDKDAARPLVAKMIDELSQRGQTLFVRVNRLETGLTGFDLEAVTPPRPLRHPAAQGRIAGPTWWRRTFCYGTSSARREWI